MILVDKRIQALTRFGHAISLVLEGYNSDSDTEFNRVINKAKSENPWFTGENILVALNNWALALEKEKIEKWAEKYLNTLKNKSKELNVAVINAGNIPFVGLHDLLTVILTGNRYIGKNATGDSILLPYLASLMIEVDPSLKDKIHFVSRLESMDVVIATGNNNSARYFEYYFGRYPHVIRKNRNGVGVLSGNETKEQIHELGKDIFTYFGLGCRNVSKLYVPKGYSFNAFFEGIEDFNGLLSHSKYMNNFDYNNSVFLLKRIPFLQNGFSIVRKENQIASPVAVLHYEEYNNVPELIKNLTDSFSQLQCVVSANNFISGNEKLETIHVDFGKTQSPALWDYADGADTVEFLCSL